MIVAEVWTKANTPVWALVCGFPGEKRRKRLLLMLKAFVDESQKDDVFVIAGYISTAEKWASFSDDWQKALDTRSPHFRTLSEFKMNEMCMHSSADMEQTGWFYSIIEEHVLAAFSVMFPISALRNAIHRLPHRARIQGIEKLENPYYFGFRAFVDLLMQNQKMLGLHSPIDFIFDDKSEKKPCLEGWEIMKNSPDPEVVRLFGDMPTFKDSFQVLPLQAADLYSGWVRHWAHSGILEEGIDKQKFPWKTNREMTRLAHWFDEEGIYGNLKRIYDAAFAEQSENGFASFKKKYPNGFRF